MGAFHLLYELSVTGDWTLRTMGQSKFGVERVKEADLQLPTQPHYAP
jgi:hypothetical protein